MEDYLPSIETVSERIQVIRRQRVILDRDLAELYGVKNKALKQAVRRNITRFPDDFMFELSDEEWQILRSQFVASSWGGTRYPPMVFTEQGVAMLSSVLRSDQAIQLNIQIMRVFTRLRHYLLDNQSIKKELDRFRSETNHKFDIIFKTLDRLIQEEEKPKRKIGFNP